MHPTSGGDQPLYVPEELEADHLEEARRTVARSGRRRIARRWVPLGAGRRKGSPRQRLVQYTIVLHVLAAVLAVVFSGMTDTWLVGLAVVVLVALSLAGIFGVLRLVDSAREADAAEERRRRRT